MKIWNIARIKITAGYVAIIMIVSFAFSSFLYRGVMDEVQRGFRLRATRLPFYTQDLLDEDESLYQEIRRQVIARLAFVNLLILGGSAGVGYFLAGRMLDPIQKMVEDQKRFVGDASHELRTPLTSLKTEMEVALRDPKIDASTKELLISNLEEVNKMQSLTTYLLSLTRYENGDMTLQKEEMLLNDAVKKAVESLEKVALQKNIKIITKLTPVTIIGNKASIVELVTILLDNAIKYSKPQGRIVIKTYQKQGQKMFSVEDFGYGIKASDLPYIFNRFYRADSSRTKQKTSGYGLGLSIAKSIVSLHNAKITVKSMLEKGTTFTVVFHT